MNSDTQTAKISVRAKERNDLDRLMMIWANTFPDLPEDITLIKYEYFSAKTVGMALSAIEGAYITKRYVNGGHVAEYPFEIHYQIEPPGTSDNKRLKAVELLNAFGEWAEENWPELGDGQRVMRLEVTDRASYLGATEDLYEDYIIPLKMTYETMETTDPWFI